MATYKSSEVRGARRQRPVSNGMLQQAVGTLTIPSGTLLTTSDTLRLVRLDVGKIVPLRVSLDISGNLDGHATLGSRTLTGSLGYLRSTDRFGTNLSLNAAGSAATESSALLLATTTTPVVAGSVTSVTNFGGAAGVGQLASGGAAVYNNLAGSLDPTGYDANVMDVAVSFAANSSTATTADVTLRIFVDFLPIGNAPSTYNFNYRNVYTSAGVSTAP